MKSSSSLWTIRAVRKAVLCLTLAGASLQITRAQSPAPEPYSCDFESPALPAGWKIEGNVTLDSSAPFEGKQSLLFTRTKPDAEKPCSATSPDFKVIPGIWDIKGGVKPDLYSPDSSFEAVVLLDLLDASGKVLDEKTVSNVFGQNGWNPFETQIEIPKNAVAAHFRAELHKTYGHYGLDALSATYVGEAPHKVIDRLVFSTVALGNLLYPTDSRVVGLRVETLEELPTNERVVHFGVRDYWGAEQMKPVDVSLTASDKKGDDGRLVYEGSVDLAQAHLEEGRYYEMYGEIPQKDKPFRNYSGFAIEPESVNNQYPPQDVPFSGRNWDGRIPEGFDLSHRMGIRIMNLWSGWDATAPYTPHAPCIELCEKYNMGAIFGTPDGAIEGHVPGWQKYDTKALHDGIKNLLNTYGKKVPAVYIDLGNEPAVLPDRIADDVKAYKAVYEGAKEANPNAFVISTSVGPTDEFFKGGFGKYCDAYDFHIYEDPANVALTLQKYQAMFKTYGNPKPVWSTELGLNSQGVARYTVSIDMVKKFALFFANGGANMSWFDLFYPDKDGTIADSNGASFDVFDSRYVKYNPKFTAVTYFDLLNAISIKKFIEQKTYGDDIHAFLFRDKNNDELEILWKDKGRLDVSIPLADIDKVEAIRLDGSHRQFTPMGWGVTLTVSEEPILLLYKGTASLANTLSMPRASLTAVPASIVRGGSVTVNVALNNVTFNDVNLIAPPFWQVTKMRSMEDKSFGKQHVSFKVTAPTLSQVREADMTIKIGDGKGSTLGELYLRPKVTAQISTALVPVPPADGGEPAVKMTLQNNGAQKQDVNWSLAVVEENALVDGAYDTHRPTKVHFKGDTQGKLSLDPGASQDITLPLEDTDPLNVYRVRAVVTDSLGETAVRERNIAGFVSVPKATGPIKLDGVLDEADWKRAPVEEIDEARQYYSFDKANVKWKGLQDLSGTIRYLWDDKYLYVGVEVTDDKQGAIKEDSMLWDMDGLQFLIDPCRNMDENVGKYDYAMAVGKKGPQAWCSLTADAGAPNGDAKDIIVSYQRHEVKTGNITYELAIPWYRVAPFKPGIGADLGLTMILNEDDGGGRKSFMTWFGNAHSKQVDGVGDLILAP